MILAGNTVQLNAAESPDPHTRTAWMPLKRHARSSASRARPRRHAGPRKGLGGTRASQDLGNLRGPIPEQLWCDLEFSDTVLLQLTTGVPQFNLVHALNDPWLADGVNQAAYFAELGALYNEYVCTGSKIQLTIQQVDSNVGVGGVGPVIGLWPAPVTGSSSVTTPATVDDLRAFPQAKWTASDAYSAAISSLRHGASIKQYLGVDAKDAPEFYGSTSGSLAGPGSPLTRLAWCIGAYTPAATVGVQGGVNILVKITYKVRFSEPVRATTYKVVDRDEKTGLPIGPEYLGRAPSRLERLREDAKAIMSATPSEEDDDDGELLTVPPAAAASPPTAAASPPTAATGPRTLFPRFRS